MFIDTEEGQTHSQNDGCGSPQHNNVVYKILKRKDEDDFDEYYIRFCIGNQCFTLDYSADTKEEVEPMREFLQRAFQKLYDHKLKP